MKIMQRRALSLLLAAAMIISILPTAVLAQLAEPNSSWVDEKIREINDALPEGQKYTKNSWYRLGNTDLYRLSLTRLIDGPDGTITDTIVFIAPGEGAGKDNSSIPDYQNATSDRPWRDANPSAVYIADGVTGVGAHAFDTITTIQTLEIENPSSLTYVGAFAFNGCDNLSFTADDPLDLSSVINMGENAFNGCSRLRNVKLGEGLTEIPKNAFNSCGLTSIEIPVGVKTIGANAFSNNSFREQNGETLILPEGLEAIGDNAFFILPNDTTAAGGFKTLVIPYTVSSIGSGAFSGHRKLSSVTIQDEINGGNGPSQLEYLGSAAFGKDTYTAYSETRTIVDEINPDITYTGLTGADFYLPNDKDIQELFINGDTCYTGNISPLIYDGTVEPTCEEDGYHIYKQTVPNTSIAGQTVEMTLHVRIEALGHEWVLAKEYGPSCEDDSYKLLICKNDPTHMQKTDTGYNGVKTDHDYKLKEIVGYKLGEGSVTITYECQKDTHDNDRDSCDKILNIVIDVAALSGTTAQVIGDLQLPHLSNGTLEWADDVDLEEELTESTEYLHVKFTPDEVDYADYTGVTGTAIDGDNSGELLIKVDVTKAKLDFSRVAFNNVRNFIVPNSYEYRYITVDKIGLPDDVTYDSPLYYDDTGYSDNKPRYSLAHEWNGTVQVTFEYNPEKYVVDTGKRPPAGYEFDTSVSGKVVISHSYDIIAQSMDLLAAKAIQGLVYSGTPQPTVRLSDVPYESTISWTWEATEGSGNGSGEAVSPSNSNTIEVAGITEAGTYNVKITVTKDGYETKELEAIQVTIDKCTIVTPAAATGLQYTGQEQIGVVTAPNAEDKYTITGNMNVNAGTYTAKASLSDKDNYKWSTTDSSEDVDIVWSIAKRRIVETNIDGAYSYPVPYTGQEQQAVKLPSSPSGFFEVSYENGTLIGKYDSDGDKIFDTVAFTISNSKRTNAGSYPVYAKVTDFENFCWAGHADSEEYFMGTWVISTKQVNAPALSAEDAVYDGNPYDEEVSLIHSSASGSNASSHGIIAGVDKLSYYTQSAGGTALNEVPTNAGTYYVEAEWEYEPGLFADNYLILGATRKQFTIEKKELALTAPTEGLNVQYTGTEYTVPAPDVRGLVKDGDEYSIVYTYKYTPLDGEEGSEQYSAGALKVTMAGTYKIIAQIAENCVNYKSEPSEEYVFRIGSSSQTVKLEDEEGNPIQDQSTITKILGEEEFTIFGKGYVGDSDIESGAAISYEITKGEDIVSLDQTGKVTLHKAGTAEITVTASKSGNYAAGSASYTVEVEKADAHLTLSEQTFRYNGSEITDYANAVVENAGNGAVPVDMKNISYTFYYDAGDTAGEEMKEVPSEAGSYWLKATLHGDPNYNDDEVCSKIIITERELEAEIVGYIGVYDGREHDAATVQEVVGVNGGISADAYDVKYAVTNTDTQPDENSNDWSESIKVKNVTDGTGVYYWYKIEAANYETKIGNFTVNITPAELRIEGLPESFQKEYDGSNTANIENSGDILIQTGIESETINVESVSAEYENKNAGTEKDVAVFITLSEGDASNVIWGNYVYNGTALTDNSLTIDIEAAGTIDQKRITVNGGIETVNKVYDGSPVIELSGIPETAGFVESDVDSGEIYFDEIETEKGTTADSNVGAQKTVTVALDVLNGLLGGAGAGNYIVAEDYDDIKADITKRPVYLLFPNQEDQSVEWEKDVYYDPQGLIGQQNEYAVSAEPKNDVKNSGFVGTDGVALERTDIVYVFSKDGSVENNPVNLGTYTVTASLSDEVTEKFSNYSVAQVQGSITIIQNNAQLNVDVKIKNDLTYTGQGIYPIDDIEVKGGNEVLAENENGYAIFYSLTGDDGSYNLSTETLTSAIVDAKTYDVYWKVITTNYGDQTGNFSVTVDRATLTLDRIVDTEKTYDGTIDAVDQITEVNLSGQKNNEEISASVYSANYDEALKGDDRAIHIVYQLNASGNAKLENYKVSIANAEATEADEGQISETVEGSITPAPLHIKIYDQESVYDGNRPEVENVKELNWEVDSGEIYQLVNGSDDDLQVVLSIEEENAKDVDVYTIKGVAGNENYKVEFTNGKFTVKARYVEVIIEDYTGVYGDIPDKDRVSLTAAQPSDENSGMVGEESTELFRERLSIEADETSSIGEYDIVGINGICGNYDVEFTEGKYSIERRPVTITIDDKQSCYGCKIEDLTYSDSYTDNAGKKGIVNGDDLGIQLNTDASEYANADKYAIVGTVDEVKAQNYIITWSGNWNNYDESSEKSGVYTINRADLSVEFTNETVNVSMGSSVSNPLKYFNTSCNAAEAITKPDGVVVQYSSDNKGVALVDEYTGAVSIVSPGDAVITAEVIEGGNNFNGNSETSYDLHVAVAGQGIQVQPMPMEYLKYNGKWQELLQDYIVTPDDAHVEFTVTPLESGDQCMISDDGMPLAKDAGIYKVEWQATKTGYTAVSGWFNVNIDKADPSGGFTPKSVQIVYEEGKVFDCGNIQLDIAGDYDGEITYTSDNTAVAKVNDNQLSNISIYTTGNATINAKFPQTDNYNSQTVYLDLEVIDATTAISYSAEDYSVTYDGRPHGSRIEVNSPSDYVIYYSDDEGESYDLTDSPTIEDVGEDGTLKIYFQIQARGYKSVSGVQEITVLPREIDETMVSGVAGSYTYTGQQITTPTVNVVCGSIQLDEGTDYEITYGDNVEVGKSSDMMLADGGGYVQISGIGNYTGSVVKYFEITAVMSNYLSAELDRYFGYYGDNDTDSAIVTVMHGDHEVTNNGIDNVAVYVDESDGCTVEGQTVTFHEVGIYTINVEVTGGHSGSFVLHYTLLPQNDGEFEITGLNDNIVVYDGRDHVFDPKVSLDEESLIKDKDYILTYSYTPFCGSEIKGEEYDPETVEMVEAGLYIVTASGIGNYIGSGTAVLLISQRDLADSSINAEILDVTYNGEEQEPEVTLTYDGTDVGDLNDTEYSYNIDAGEAVAISSAADCNNNFRGIRMDTFRINPKELNDVDFTAVADPYEYWYTGSAIYPVVVVTDLDTNKVLTQGIDYRVSSNAVEPGYYKAEVVGMGNYMGTVMVDFSVVAKTGPEPATEFTLTVNPKEWTYVPSPQVSIDVQFNDNTLSEDNYMLTVERDGEVVANGVSGEEAISAMTEPGKYTITAIGTGIYDGYSDTDEVSVLKIQPIVTVKAEPNSVIGGETVELKISGSDLPDDIYLPDLLDVQTENGILLDLNELDWIQSGNEWVAEFEAADAKEVYIFTIEFEGDRHYKAASDSDVVTSSAAGGDVAYIIDASAGRGGCIDPSGRISVAEGDDQRFIFEADNGYVIADVMVDGESIGARNYYTFTDVDDNHTIRVIFRRLNDDVGIDDDLEEDAEEDEESNVADPDDTGVSDWLNTQEHINYLNGYDTGEFKPDENMTRAEAAQMFYNLLLNKNVPVTASFEDVPDTAWYADAVNALASMGILNGYGDNTYAPERPITRAEFTVIAMRFAKLDTSGVNIFSDVKQTDWFYTQVVGSIKYGWINGYSDGTFRPNAFITRAEVTTIVNRMLGRVADRTYIDSHSMYLKQFVDVSRLYWGYYEITEAANAHSYSVTNGKEEWLWL